MAYAPWKDLPPKPKLSLNQKLDLFVRDQITCLRCGAGPGMPCKTTSGGLSKQMHQIRKEETIQIVGEAESNSAELGFRMGYREGRLQERKRWLGRSQDCEMGAE